MHSDEECRYTSCVIFTYISLSYLLCIRKYCVTIKSRIFFYGWSMMTYIFCINKWMDIKLIFSVWINFNRESWFEYFHHLYINISSRFRFDFIFIQILECLSNGLFIGFLSFIQLISWTRWEIIIHFWFHPSFS